MLSPTDKTVVPLQVTYEDASNCASEMVAVYNGVTYKGNGTDYLWTDTLADLQSKFPQDVKIACCMTCRHGNMCPYGNIENQLFCTKDLKISNKEDMCHLFDDTDPFEKRKVSSFNYCEDFVYQCKDYYTYNDYLYQLQVHRDNP